MEQAPEPVTIDKLLPSIIDFANSSLQATQVEVMRAFKDSSAMPADRQNELTVEDGVWQPFSLELLADLRNQKQAVFVDITADWCVTCQVNKQLVLERKPVLQSFAKADVKLLRADWTRPNDMIADYLLKYDRFGIPFNSLYLPDMAEPVIFSELLVAEKIINLLENRLR